MEKYKYVLITIGVFLVAGYIYGEYRYNNCMDARIKQRLATTDTTKTTEKHEYEGIVKAKLDTLNDSELLLTGVGDFLKGTWHTSSVFTKPDTVTRPELVYPKPDTIYQYIEGKSIPAYEYIKARPIVAYMDTTITTVRDTTKLHVKYSDNTFKFKLAHSHTNYELTKYIEIIPEEKWYNGIHLKLGCLYNDTAWLRVKGGYEVESLSMWLGYEINSELDTKRIFFETEYKLF